MPATSFYQELKKLNNCYFDEKLIEKNLNYTNFLSKPNSYLIDRVISYGIIFR